MVFLGCPRGGATTARHWRMRTDCPHQARPGDRAAVRCCGMGTYCIDTQLRSRRADRRRTVCAHRGDSHTKMTWSTEGPTSFWSAGAESFASSELLDFFIQDSVSSVPRGLQGNKPISCLLYTLQWSYIVNIQSKPSVRQAQTGAVNKSS